MAYQTDWPTQDTVLARLKASKMVDEDEGIPYLGHYAEAALDMFEADTGYMPFKSIASASYYYDSPGLTPRGSLGRHSLGGGKVLVLTPTFTAVTAVRVGITADDDDGTLLVENRDYYLKPFNRSAKRRPIEWIEFATPVYHGPRGIKVVGTAGFTDLIPEGAFETVLDGACMLAGADILGVNMQGLSSWKEGDSSEDLGEAMPRTVAAFVKGYQLGVRRYRRPILI
jgi:hypothetical protein